MKRTTTKGTAKRRSPAARTPRDEAALDAEAAEPVKRDAFNALDPVSTAKGNLNGTLAVIVALLDSDAELDEDGQQTMIRHLKTDADALDAAFDAAWDTLVKRGGNK